MKLDKQTMIEQSVKYGAKAADLAACGLKKASSAMENFARRLSKTVNEQPNDKFTPKD